MAQSIKGNKIGIFLLLLPNFILLFYHLYNLIILLWEDYSHEGLRFIMFLFLIDILCAVVLLYAVLKTAVNREVKFWAFFSYLANHVIMVIGVDYIPIVGLLICIVSFVIFVLNKKQYLKYSINV